MSWGFHEYMKRLPCGCPPPPQDGGNTHSNTGPGPGGQRWPSLALTWWAESGELPVQDGGGAECGGPRPPASNHVLARDASSGPSSLEKDAKGTDQPDQDRGKHFSESDPTPMFHRQRGVIREDETLPRLRALDPGAGFGGGLSKALDVNSYSSSSMVDQVQPSPREEQATAPQEPTVSHVPLTLKVCGQSSGLGISIAGGKGSLPYRERDEGIFISRVSEGGPSDKAGIHVGDRLLEVNGLDMRGMAHHGAVRALRHAGSCITMKVLREKMLPIELCIQGDPVARDPGAKWSERRYQHDHVARRLVPKVDHTLEKIDMAVCNGSTDLETDPNWKLFKREPDARTITNPFQGEKNTMTIPRIILTHPSISDDDVELWSQGAEGEPLLAASDSADVLIRSGGFKSPHYPP